MSTELQEELSALKALIAKSSLVEVEATKVVDRGGHPVIVKDGTMLVHKDDGLRVQQRTKDIQKLAAMSRELAQSKARNQALREVLERIKGKANHSIPYYAYGGNQAGAMMHELLSEIFKESEAALNQGKEKE